MTDPGRVMLLLCLMLIHPHAYSEEIELVVNVVGVNPGSGFVVLSVFDSPASYMVEPAVERTIKVGDADSVTFVLKGLATGRFSVSAFYDENGNGELDTGMLGVPKELVGFSNNAKGLFGPPSFDKTSFGLSESRTLEIQLKSAKE